MKKIISLSLLLTVLAGLNFLNAGVGSTLKTGTGHFVNYLTPLGRGLATYNHFENCVKNFYRYLSFSGKNLVIRNFYLRQALAEAGVGTFGAAATIALIYAYARGIQKFAPSLADKLYHWPLGHSFFDQPAPYKFVPLPNPRNGLTQEYFPEVTKEDYDYAENYFKKHPNEMDPNNCSNDYYKHLLEKHSLSEHSVEENEIILKKGFTPRAIIACNKALSKNFDHLTENDYKESKDYFDFLAKNLDEDVCRTCRTYNIFESGSSVVNTNDHCDLNKLLASSHGTAAFIDHFRTEYIQNFLRSCYHKGYNEPRHEKRLIHANEPYSDARMLTCYKAYKDFQSRK